MWNSITHEVRKGKSLPRQQKFRGQNPRVGKIHLIFQVSNLAAGRPQEGSRSITIVLVLTEMQEPFLHLRLTAGTEIPLPMRRCLLWLPSSHLLLQIQLQHESLSYQHTSICWRDSSAFVSISADNPTSSMSSSSVNWSQTAATVLSTLPFCQAALHVFSCNNKQIITCGTLPRRHQFVSSQR